MMDYTAFPSHGTMGEVVQEGMSLRDYFAAAALQCLLGKGFEMAAKQAYEYADAMLKARE